MEKSIGLLEFCEYKGPPLIWGCPENWEVTEGVRLYPPEEVEDVLELCREICLAIEPNWEPGAVPPPTAYRKEPHKAMGYFIMQCSDTKQSLHSQWGPLYIADKELRWWFGSSALYDVTFRASYANELLSKLAGQAEQQWHNGHKYTDFARGSMHHL